MLETEGTSASKLGYDRPSPKLLGFLKKHYGLADYIPQNNNFVVYSQYFTSTTIVKANCETVRKSIRSYIHRK